MKIYFIRAISAVINLVYVTLVIRYADAETAENYLLVISQVVLAALLFGFGTDTTLERFGLQLSRFRSNAYVSIFIAAVSAFKLFLVISLVWLCSLFGYSIFEITEAVCVYIFLFILFNSLSALFSGLGFFFETSVAGLVRSSCRLPLFLFLLNEAGLERLLIFEVAALVAAIVVVLFSTGRGGPNDENSNDNELPHPFSISDINKFMATNYVNRILLSLISLNTLKIIILRSNHPNALMYAYILQLTESLERFSPNLVLASKYRPLLSRLYDREGAGSMQRVFRRATKTFTIVSVVFSLTFFLAVVAVLPKIYPNDVSQPVYFIAFCSLWLVLSNVKGILNIYCNVIRKNSVQLVSSLVAVSFLLGTIAAGRFGDPENGITIFSIILLTYSATVLMLLFAKHRRSN